jgi:hypothetical protein
MDAFERGKIIGASIIEMVIPFLLSWFLVWLYEKIRKKTVTRRTSKILSLGILIYLLTSISNK